MAGGEKRYEALGGSVSVCVSGRHRFGTDAFLLSDFAAPRTKDRVCDLGAGCGIIPLYLYKEYSPAAVVGVELLPEADALFREGIARSGAEGTVRAVNADLKDAPALLGKGSFDLVTCNPPYYANGTGLPSGDAAARAARHETFCTAEDVCRSAAALLRYGGRLCLCQRPERLADVVTAMRQNALEPKRLRFVAKDPESRPWLFLLEGRKGGKPSLKVEPTLFLKEGGVYFGEKQKEEET